MSSTGNEPVEPCVQATLYNFQENGTVSVENDGSTTCKEANHTMKWMVVMLHDSKGKEHLAVRMFEEGIGERPSYDGNTFTDDIYMFVSFKKKFFTWIPKPQYKAPVDTDMQSYFRRM